jgi:hypothetical protein
MLAKWEKVGEVKTPMLNFKFGHAKDMPQRLIFQGSTHSSRIQLPTDTPPQLIPLT